MRGSIRLLTLSLACALFLLVPAPAFAQGSITGAVKDATGALLPGVTVEASSPALIEKVRSVVSDGAGQYRIVDLRPGTYTVTFTLPGFGQHKREGIELTGSFTASVDAELKVGAVEESVTVSGEAPIVDVQTVTQQRVISKEVIDAIPAGRGQSALAVLIPGMVTGGQDVGGQNTQSLSAISIHGGRGTDQRQTVDGLTLRNVAGQGNSTNTVVDIGSSQEMTVDYAAGSAEADHRRRALQLHSQGQAATVSRDPSSEPSPIQTSRTAISPLNCRRRVSEHPTASSTCTTTTAPSAVPFSGTSSGSTRARGFSAARATSPACGRTPTPAIPPSGSTRPT